MCERYIKDRIEKNLFLLLFFIFLRNRIRLTPLYALIDYEHEVRKN